MDSRLSFETRARRAPQDEVGDNVTGVFAGTTMGSPRQILQQQIQRRRRKHMHVGRAGRRCRSPASSPHCSGPGDPHAAMAGGVAVAVAGRSGRAGFRQSPVGGKALADLVRQQFGVELPRRSGCPSSPRRGCPSGSAARRGYRPPRSRGNRPRRRAPRAMRPKSIRRSRTPRPRWSGAARSVWRRCFRRSGQGLSSNSQFLRKIRFNNPGWLSGLSASEW